VKLGQEHRFKNPRRNLAKRTGARGDTKSRKQKGDDLAEAGLGES
jgi:hypothetical protein